MHTACVHPPKFFAGRFTLVLLFATLKAQRQRCGKACYAGVHAKALFFSAADTLQGGGEFRPGTISQGMISPGENFATLEIPKAPSKHVSRKMSLNFRKKMCLSVSICPFRT